MNISVLTDEVGKILFIQRSNRLSEIEDSNDTFKGNASIVSEVGQHLHNIDIPSEFQKIPLTELLTRFRINLKADKPCLQSLDDV